MKRITFLFWTYFSFILCNAQSCNDLSNPQSLSDGNTIILTDDCVVNATQIIAIDGIKLTIDGQSNGIHFQTSNFHIFNISNSATLILRNLSIQISANYNDSLSVIDSILYLTNNSSLTLNSVHFISAIPSIKHIVYSPQSQSSSSLTMQHIFFDSDFAMNGSAIYMVGTKEESQEYNAKKTQITLSNVVYNQMSNSFLMAFCSKLSISNSNFSNNAITDCLLCLEENTMSVVENNYFFDNIGTVIQMNDILTLNMTKNEFINHTNNGIILQTQTEKNTFSKILMSELNVKESKFEKNAFFIVSSNTQTNIKIFDSVFYQNHGMILSTANPSMQISDSCLDEYNEQSHGIWVMNTQIIENVAANDTFFDIKSHRLSLNEVTLSNNSLNVSLFRIYASSLSISNLFINDNLKNAFDDVFGFEQAKSLCFDTDFMFYAFNVSNSDFTMSHLFNFSQIIDVKGIGMSHFEMDNCNEANSMMNPLEIEYLKLSHFNATNCTFLSLPLLRADNGVKIEIFDSFLMNSSLSLNVHVFDEIIFEKCSFDASFVELSSALLSHGMTKSLRYGMFDTNVFIQNCLFFGGNINQQMIGIYANDLWLPSITFSNTQFFDLTMDQNESALIVISTQMIMNETNNLLLPFGQSSIEFKQCHFHSLSSLVFNVMDDAIFLHKAPISKIFFKECTFEQIESNIIYHEFEEHTSMKYEFESNVFSNISVSDVDNFGLLHFEGSDCNDFDDNDVSFSLDKFEFIEADKSIIHGRCINFALNKVSMDSNKAKIAYGLSLSQSNVILSKVTMTNNSDSTFGAVHCFSMNGDDKSCNVQIRDSQFIANEAMYGGAISFKTSIQTQQTSSLYIYSSDFVNNIAAKSGGAVYIDDAMTTFDENMFIFDRVSFEHNNAMNGGAVFIKESSLKCIDCHFLNNTALQFGGSMLLISDICFDETLYNDLSKYSKLIIYGMDTKIMQNNALFGGGLALFCYDFTSQNVQFSNNGQRSLTDRGGAIFSHKTCLSSIQNNTFSDNYAHFGGAIAISAPMANGCNNSIQQSIFDHNIGTTQSGAILITSSYVDMNEYALPFNEDFNISFAQFWFDSNDDVMWKLDVVNNTFLDNIGGNHGGAILITPKDFASNATMSKIENDTDLFGVSDAYMINIFDSHFVNNTILNDEGDDINFDGGGAIAWFLRQNSSAIMNIFGCDFDQNEANYGQGGALYVNCYECMNQNESSFLQSTASFDILRENACQYCSFDDYGTNSVHLNVDSLIFENNVAAAGGAMSISCIGYLKMSNVEFKDHNAQFYGGSVYLHNLQNVSIDDMQISNSSTYYFDGDYIDSKGGGMYGSCILNEIEINNAVINNSQSIIGGAIFLYQTVFTMIENAKFNQNNAFLAGGSIAIFSLGMNSKNEFIHFSNVNFSSNGPSYFGSTIFIGSHRDIILLFDGRTQSDESYPPLLDVWDFLYEDKRRIVKNAENKFLFESNKYAQNTMLNVSRIVIDIDIESDFAFSASPQWKEDDAMLTDLSGNVVGIIDFERSFGNVLFLQNAENEFEYDKNVSMKQEAISMDVSNEYLFLFNGERWTDALDKNTSKNVTFRWNLIAMLENNDYFDQNTKNIDVTIENCKFFENGMKNEQKNVIGNVFVDDPFGITAISVINNDFLSNKAKIGSSFVHLSGYRKNNNPINLDFNQRDNIQNCTFIDGISSDTGNIVIQNVDLSIAHSSCQNNAVGLDGSCVFAYSSTLNVFDVDIIDTLSQVSGAIYCDLSILRVEQCNFTNNIANFGDGAAIYSKRSMPIVLGQCPLFTFDTATNESLFSVIDCMFDSNKAFYGSGAAIYIGTDYDDRLFADNVTCALLNDYDESDINVNVQRRRLLSLNESDYDDECVDIQIIADYHISDINWTLYTIDYTKNEKNMIGNSQNGNLSQCVPVNADYANVSCFEFVIFDKFGDGLSYGKGTYFIEWNDEIWQSQSNGNYHQQESIQFCQSAVYDNEKKAVIDVTVSIIDDEDSLDFVIAFIDDIVPKFDNRVEFNLIFTNIGDRSLTSDISAFSDELNVETDCIKGGEPEEWIYCSTDGNEAIIDALAILCLLKQFDGTMNDTLREDILYFWGENSTHSVLPNNSESFAFLENECELVSIEYGEYNEQNRYLLLNGSELLNDSFHLFDANYKESKTNIAVPQIAQVPIYSPTKSWTTLWDADNQSVCDFYDENPSVIELICANVDFDINIKPTICQFESCVAQKCTESDIIIVYNSSSLNLFEEDAESYAYNVGGPKNYKITDLEFVVFGEYSLNVGCFDDNNVNVNESVVKDKGVLLLSNSSCNHLPFIVKLQNMGARAVTIGEDIAIPLTLNPTLHPTQSPTISAEDKLLIYLNATLTGMNLSHFEDNFNIFIHIINDSVLIPSQIPFYAHDENENHIKMKIRLDATNGKELYDSLKSEAANLYLDLMQWSIQFGISTQIKENISFEFISDELEFDRLAPTNKPTMEPTVNPTAAPTIQSVFIPVRSLDGPKGRRFAQIAYNESIKTTQSDLRASFLCNVTLPTPQPTPSPTLPNDDGKNVTKRYLSDEVSIYGYNSNSTQNANAEWIVSLSEYVYNAECKFVDETNDELDVNDTSECKPRLNDLYNQCLMEVAVDEDGTIINSRNAQIDTIISSVDTLCIYMNIEENDGFLVPFDDNLNDNDLLLDMANMNEFDLRFEANGNETRQCRDRYLSQNGLINLKNLQIGTFCFFIDESDENEFKLSMKRVYEWTAPFMHISHSLFIDNFAQKNGGALSMISEKSGDYSSMLVSHCIFYQNNASKGFGGAIYKQSAIDDLVDNAMSILQIEYIQSDQMKFNEAFLGGGAIAIQSPDYTNLYRTVTLIKNVEFESNFAYFYGGAIYSKWSNVYTVNCDFSSNFVLRSGGAIYLDNSAFGALKSTFSFNEAINESAILDIDDDDNILYEVDNDGGAVYSSFYNDSSSNAVSIPCVGFYNVHFKNNTAGNAGGAIYLGLFGDEANFGQSCVKFSNVLFGNGSNSGANKAFDGGRSVFLNVSAGLHPILLGDTSVTSLCFSESSICQQFESTVYYMCVQRYEVAGGLCDLNISQQINEANPLWIESISEISLASTKNVAKNIAMFPGESQMFQVFGWDVYGNKLFPNEWQIDLVTVLTAEDVIDLTETIESPVFDSWLFPLFSKAASVGDIGQGKIFDLNGVAADLFLNILIVNCSDGFYYQLLSGSDRIYTCTACAPGSYIMNSNECVTCPLGLECLGTSNVLIQQYWYGKPQTNGQMALQLCPPGVCCNDPNGCAFSDPQSLCALNRNSSVPLCGACNDGFSETSSSAGACGKCGRESPLIFLLWAAIGCFVLLFYMKRLSKIKQDIPHPLVAYMSRSVLFVFQLLPILTFQSSSTLFAPLSALANFEIDTSGVGGAGQCYLQNMGPRTKIGIGLVPSSIFMGQLFVIILLTRCFISSDAKFAKMKITFFRTFNQLAIILYAKFTASLLKLTDCRRVGEEFGTRMWYAGSIECYDGWHYAAYAGLGLMFIAPFIVVYFLRREYVKHVSIGAGWKNLRKTYPALVMPYRRKRYWYSAWNLGRRFILIGIASFPTSRPDFSATALAVVVGAVLGFHVFCRPFYHEINNKLESYSLFCAFGVSILNIMLNKPPFYANLTAFLAFAPLIPIPFLFWSYLSDKSPYSVAVTSDKIKEKEQSLRALPSQRRTLRNNENYQKTMRHLQHQIKKQTKQQDAAWKSLAIFGDRKLHLIKKRDLMEEGNGGNNNHIQQRSSMTTALVYKKEEDDEYYPSSDDRSWSGLSRDSRELTKDEDFVDEVLDNRSFWQVLAGKKIENVESETSSSGHEEDDISLRVGEVKIDYKSEGNSSSDDYKNDYWIAQKLQKKEKTLFGGKLKFKRGLKEKRKIHRQKKEILEAAKQKETKRKRQKNKKRKRTKSTLRKDTKNEAYFEDYEGVGIGSIELTSFKSMTSLDAVSDFDEIDPFEIERKEAVRKRKERMERKKKFKNAKSNEQKLESLWGGTSEIASLSNIDDVATAAINYIEETKEEEEESEESDDGVPANELLDDGGQAVIKQSVMMAMSAIFDIVGGNDLNHIDKNIEYVQISEFEIDDDEM